MILEEELETNNEFENDKAEKKENVTSKNRQGNLEILRILCMILIIFHHYCVHGGLQNADVLLGNELVSIIGIIVGKAASNTFALITGFFLFKYRFKIQKVIKLYFEVLFYAILVSIIMIILLGKAYAKNIIYEIFPISLNVNWFITAYIVILFLIPLIRPALDKLTKLEYLKILFFLGLGISIIPSIASIFLNIGIEPFGKVISKFNICILKKKIYDIISILIMLLVFNPINYISSNQIGSVVVAILLFDLFRKMNIKNNKIITFFSSSCLGVLLLHDNIFFNEQIWMYIFKTQYYYNAPTITLLKHILLCIISIFLIGSVIDFIRRKIEDKVINKVLNDSKKLNRINEIFECTKPDEKII